MRYRRRMGTGTWVVLGVLALALLGTGIFLGLRAGKPAQGKDVQVMAMRDNVLLPQEELTEECTYDKVTFKVGKDWTKVEGTEAAFVHSDGVSQYRILGTSRLGKGVEPEEFFTELVALRLDEGCEIDAKGLKVLAPYVTEDGTEGYVGRITYIKDGNVHVEEDVLILPGRDYVVTLAGMCDKDSKLPFDLRVITDTVRINN